MSRVSATLRRMPDVTLRRIRLHVGTRGGYPSDATRSLVSPAVQPGRRLSRAAGPEVSRAPFDAAILLLGDEQRDHGPPERANGHGEGDRQWHPDSEDEEHECGGDRGGEAGHDSGHGDCSSHPPARRRVDGRGLRGHALDRLVPGFDLQLLLIPFAHRMIRNKMSRTMSNVPIPMYMTILAFVEQVERLIPDFPGVETAAGARVEHGVFRGSRQWVRHLHASSDALWVRYAHSELVFSSAAGSADASE